MMRRPTYALGAAIAVAAVVAPRPVAAQEDPAALIALIEKQPADLDRAAWKERRREAARKLIATGDKRAVPVMIRLAEGESFDIIGEIAIEGLGKLGDASAIPALERVAADNSRDRAQRDLARKALAKLGGKAPAATPTPPPAPTPPPDRVAAPPPADDGGDRDAFDGSATAPDPGEASAPPASDTGGGGHGVFGGGGRDAAVVGQPTWDDDVLAARESLTFAVGAASFDWDTVRERTSFVLDADSHYARRLERETMAWGVTADLDTLVGVLNPAGDASSRLVAITAAVEGEARFYGGPGVYGVGQVAIAPQLHYLSSVGNDGMTNVKDTRFVADAGLALGGGYGRVLDVGPRLRVQRLAAVLEDARALGRPIDDGLARRLQSTWWALRRDRTGYRQLTATVAILREAGVLLGEPDAGTTYELLEVLRDASFDVRPSGLDVQILFGESYLVRNNEDGDGLPDVPDGRYEQVMVRARAARQLGLAADAQAWLDARYRLFTPEMTATPWRAAVGGRFRTFAHGEHGELLGAFDVGAEAIVSSDGDANGMDEPDDIDLGAALVGELGWTWTLNRASSVRLGGEVRLAAKEVFIGLALTGSYGFLDAGFARSAP